MRVPQQTFTHQQRADLEIARKLARMGVPVILLTRTNSKGEPIPPRDWQQATALDSFEAIDRWRPGYALGAVCGVAIDILDVDPRNGGTETWAGLKEAGRVPAVYGVTGTASDGLHHWIARVGARKVSRGGIDLLSGDDEGAGRSFAFIPPTERRSKTTGEMAKYEWLTEPDWDGIALTQEPGFENAYAAGLTKWFGERKKAPRPSKLTPAGAPNGYGEGILVANLTAIRNATERRNNTLNDKLFAIAQLWAGGEMGPQTDERAAELQDRARDAALLTGMGLERINPTINSAWTSGVKQARNRHTYAASADVWPSPREPQAVARKWLAEPERAGRLRYWRGEWWRWSRQNGCWVATEEEQIRAYLAQRLGEAKYLNKDGAPTPWAPTPKTVTDTMRMAVSEVLLSREAEAPAWLGDRKDDPAGLIPFHNGLLRMSDRHLEPVTSELFVTSARPFEWDPLAPEPRVWLGFLDSVWPGDPASVRLLQEWMGYVLSGRIDAQKMMVLIGRPRSGKGTIARALTQLVGEPHVASATLGGASKDFGMQGWIGKSLVLLPDMRSGWGDQTAALERLLSITGGDLQAVHRKGISDWVGVLGARVMMMSNELPKLKDASAAIADRALLLNLPKSWLGNEDLTLAGRLEAELPGILRWALDGLDRLLGKGLKFTLPESAAGARAELRQQVSPAATFFAEESDQIDEEERTRVDLAYLAWCAWCRETGHPHGSVADMGREFAAVANMRKVQFNTAGSGRGWAYKGFRLTCLAPGEGLGPRPVTDFQAGLQCQQDGCTGRRFYTTDYCWAHRRTIPHTRNR